MVNYKPINNSIQTRCTWVGLGFFVFLAIITTAALIVTLSLTFDTIVVYPSFTNDIPSWWSERLQIYAETIHNNFNLKHDYRLQRNLTLYQNVNKTSQDKLPVATSRIICYYNAPNPADKYQRLRLSNVDPHLCTHINIGFIEINNSSLVLTSQLEQIFTEEVPLLRAKNADLKFLIWVGGGATSRGFPDMVHNHTTRKSFIRSIKQVLRKYRLDGVDLDWEFPSAYNKERQHFSQLLYEIKAEYVREHRPYLLSVAVAAPEGIALFAYDVRELNTYADHVNVMTYDYHFYSIHSPFTGLNAPLYARKNEHSILGTLNINYSVHWWLNNGLSPQKLIVGLPTYGHSFSLVNLFNNRIGAPASDFGRTGKEGFTTFSELCWFKENNFVVSEFYDEDTCSPYLSCGDEWISFENTKSLECKANYIKSLNLGGAMVYSLNSDDYFSMCQIKKAIGANFPLTRKIKNILFQN